MSAQIEIHYNGNVYRGKVEDEGTPKELKDVFYENMSKTVSLSLELEGGGYLILGDSAMKAAAILVIEI